MAAAARRARRLSRRPAPARPRAGHCRHRGIWKQVDNEVGQDDDAGGGLQRTFNRIRFGAIRARPLSRQSSSAGQVRVVGLRRRRGGEQQRRGQRSAETKRLSRHPSVSFRANTVSVKGWAAIRPEMRSKSATVLAGMPILTRRPKRDRRAQRLCRRGRRQHQRSSPPA